MKWKRFRIRWWWAVPSALLLVLGLYALAGYWLVPKLVRSQAVSYVAEKLGKRLTLGDVRFDPFRLRLEVDDARIDDHGAQLVALRRLAVELSASTLWHRGYILDDVQLDAPYANAVLRADGSLNLAELVPKDEKPDQPMPELWLRRFDVTTGRIDFTDLGVDDKPRTTLSPITFHLADFHSTVEGGRFRLVATSQRKERYEWTGKLSLQPLASDGTFTVAALQADTLQEFIGQRLPFRLHGGQLGATANYGFSAPRGHGLRFDATIPRIALQGWNLRARDRDEDWIRIPDAAVEDVRLSLQDRDIAIGKVRTQGLRATLWREANGHLNIERMLSPPSSPAATPAAANAGAAWKFGVGGVELDRGELAFEDRGVRPAAMFKLAPLKLATGALGLDTKQPVDIDLAAMVNGSAPLVIKGSVVPDTLAAALDIELSKLPLRAVNAYLSLPPKLRIGSGDVAATGKLTLRPPHAGGAALEFSGRGAIDGFAVADAASGDTLLSWRRLSADGLRYTSGPDALTIATVNAQAAAARIAIMADGTINLVDALGAPAGSPPASPSKPPANPQMPVNVGKLVLDAGQLGFADHSIEPNFSADIDALRGTVSGLSNQHGRVARLDLKGQVVNRFSPVEISGETDPFAFDRHTDVKMAFRNIELPIFNPYSGRFAGYAISKGKLTTELHYKIDNRVLAAEHHVVIDQLEWGEATASKDKVSLPVRLATALLKDRHGVIDLQLPVNGTLDDPKFRIGPIVWKIIGNIITKAVTAPFKLLGSLFKGAEDAQFVDFEPGSAMLTDKSKNGLSALAHALADKPELKLDIPAGAAGQLDADALRMQHLESALAAEAGAGKDFDFDKLDAGKQRDLLEKLYRRSVGHKPELPEVAKQDGQSRAEKRDARDKADVAWLQGQLAPRYNAKPAELETLGKARAAAVQEALLAGGGIDPVRVFMALDLGTVAHEGVARMELKLK